MRLFDKAANNTNRSPEPQFSVLYPAEQAIYFNPLHDGDSGQAAAPFTGVRRTMDRVAWRILNLPKE